MLGDSVRFCFPYPVGQFSGPCHFSGPDGIAHHRAHLLKDTQPIDTGPYTSLRTSDAKYLWRPAPGTPFHRPRSTIPGEVGWSSWFLVDKDPSRTGHQIYLTDISRQVEDRYTHRYQTPWLPAPGGKSKDENLNLLLARLYPRTYGPRARTQCTSHYDSALLHDCVSRPERLRTRHWVHPPPSTQTAAYPLADGTWVEEEAVNMQTVSEEAKKRGESPSIPAESAPSAPTVAVSQESCSPRPPSGNPSSTRSNSSRGSRIKTSSKSPAVEATSGLQRTSPSQPSSASDLNYNKGASLSAISFGGTAPDASQQRGEVKYCPGGTDPELLAILQRRTSSSSNNSSSWRSPDLQVNGNSSRALPPAPNASRSSAVQGYPSLQDSNPRRLSSALELRRPEGHKTTLTRSMSFN